MILREWLSQANGLDGLTIADRRSSVALADAVAAYRDGALAQRLHGRSVLVAPGGQRAAALAMLAIDGLARRMVLAPPGLSAEQTASILRDAEIDVCVTDEAFRHGDALKGAPCIEAALAATAGDGGLPAQETEWVLTTSGTTGNPKLVAHTLEGLAGGINIAISPEPGTVWSTFYDIRRYGGLQVFLRAMLGPSSLVLSDPEEPIRDFLQRVGGAGVTHILGTPSHWRMALMSSAVDGIAPRYVRLSGEIADQAILDQLKAAFPEARVAHAYASTEGGVGFTVDDGLEGFPASLVGERSGIEIMVRNDTLHVRSKRTGRQYLGANAAALIDAQGFVDSGDRVARRGDRYYFLGRNTGMINVGGIKVLPEEVETVINGHPAVALSRVRARPNPILGAVVEAEVVLQADGAQAEPAALKGAIIAHCRQHLAKHKVPFNVKFVPELPITAGGKLLRSVA
jgi:acyl-coenzyme A synthetase/AMP-(fatty) acid ligase